MSMTENEIKESKEWLQDFIRMFGCNFDDLETRSFNEIVAYLEELKQYRAIGTVKEIKIREAQFERLSARYLNDLYLLREYETIGTIGEFKALKKKEHNYDNCHNFTCRHKSREVGFNIGYNKAIDEFSERLKNHMNQFDFWKYGISDGVNCEMRNYDYMIDEIAEQMKGGGKDAENNR